MVLPILLENVRRRPHMYVPAASYDTVAAFVAGYDEALMGGLLVGFREWLIVRLQDGNNLSWPGLMRELLRRDVAITDRMTESDDDNAKIEFLFSTLTTFLSERDSDNGLRRILLEYDQWLSQQSWYGPSSPNWLDADHQQSTRRAKRRKS